jgi:hypothetical protein
MWPIASGAERRIPNYFAEEVACPLNTASFKFSAVFAFSPFA